jgi:hypothetical protein
MMAKKGKSGLPRVDRSRALPVRSGIGFYKVVGMGALVGAIVFACNRPPTVDPIVPEPPAVVAPK